MTDTTAAATDRSRPASAPLGDELPPILAGYYDDLDHGRIEAAAAAFAADARYALPPLDGDETGPRRVTVGRAALLEQFRERGAKPWAHHIELCTVDGPVALLEGVLVDEQGNATATFLASAHLDGDGLIDRYLTYLCTGARDPVPTDVAADVEPADADHVLHEYFQAMDGGDFPAAAGWFSADVLYSHPPYKHTGIDDPERIEFRGRPALEAAFRQRGKTAFDHRILVCAQRGPHAVLEGVVENLPDGGTGSFLSSLSFDAGGRIRRYVSFYCEPGVPWR